MVHIPVHTHLLRSSSVLFSDTAVRYSAGASVWYATAVRHLQRRCRRWRFALLYFEYSPNRCGDVGRELRNLRSLRCGSPPQLEAKTLDDAAALDAAVDALRCACGGVGGEECSRLPVATHWWNRCWFPHGDCRVPLETGESPLALPVADVSLVLGRCNCFFLYPVGSTVASSQHSGWARHRLLLDEDGDQ